MPGTARAVLAMAAKAGPLILKYGPRVAGAVAVLTKFAHDNPGIPAWFRARLRDVPQQMEDVQHRHGDAAKIAGTLGIIRDVARDAKTADERIDAEGYVLRADRLERGLRLVEAQEGHERKQRLTQLKADTDALLAEVLEAVTRGEDGARPA
ncbi:hypothetical protein [Amnibacterium sp.]|uniref:hypothetical protein n=1 Tax=Amnibacterium sp. TaxID=1872496 RepID=UPI003F7B4F3F